MTASLSRREFSSGTESSSGMGGVVSGGNLYPDESIQGLHKSYGNDLEEILASNMLSSQNLAHLAEFKVDRIMKKRTKKRSSSLHLKCLIDGGLCQVA